MTIGRTPHSGTREIPAPVRVLGGVLAVYWAVNLVPAIGAVVSGAPDQFHNQHWRTVTLAGGSLLLTLAMALRRGPIQYVLLGMSLLTVGVLTWLVR